MLMELPMAAVIGVLFAAGTYLILRPNLLRVVMGFGCTRTRPTSC